MQSFLSIHCELRAWQTGGVHVRPSLFLEDAEVSIFSLSTQRGSLRIDRLLLCGAGHNIRLLLSLLRLFAYLAAMLLAALRRAIAA